MPVLLVCNTDKSMCSYSIHSPVKSRIQSILQLLFSTIQAVGINVNIFIMHIYTTIVREKNVHVPLTQHLLYNTLLNRAVTCTRIQHLLGGPLRGGRGAVRLKYCSP